MKPLSLGEIESYIKLLGVRGFRGVFMREMIPNKKIAQEYECGILNLGNVDSNGTHWTCYVRDKGKTFYFDSFGNAPPPIELVNYVGPTNLFYNDTSVQNYDDPPICGHLCLEVLRRSSNGESWNTIMRVIRGNKYVWKPWWRKIVPV